MKKEVVFVLTLILSLGLCITADKAKNFYFMGQKPPSNTPRIFAPGLVSTKNAHEFSCTFSPDGKEFYFNRGLKIFYMVLREDVWSPPMEVKFTRGYRAHEPHITSDNKMLYFGSWMPQPGKNHTKTTYGIWRSLRSSNGWESAKYVGIGMYVTSTKKGDLFLTDISNPEKGISIAQGLLKNGKFFSFQPQIGGMNIPTPDHKPGRHPCISPKGDFLIFDAYLNAEEETPSLFVCFKQGGKWSEAYSLGKQINRDEAAIASLSPDGRFIFFTKKSDIYWVSSEIIQKLKLEFKKKSIKQKI